MIELRRLLISSLGVCGVCGDEAGVEDLLRSAVSSELVAALDCRICWIFLF